MKKNMKFWSNAVKALIFLWTLYFVIFQFFSYFASGFVGFFCELNSETLRHFCQQLLLWDSRGFYLANKHKKTNEKNGFYSIEGAWFLSEVLLYNTENQKVLYVLRKLQIIYELIQKMLFPHCVLQVWWSWSYFSKLIQCYEDIISSFVDFSICRS